MHDSNSSWVVSLMHLDSIRMHRNILQWHLQILLQNKVFSLNKAYQTSIVGILQVRLPTSRKRSTKHLDTPTHEFSTQRDSITTDNKQQGTHFLPKDLERSLLMILDCCRYTSI